MSFSFCYLLAQQLKNSSVICRRRRRHTINLIIMLFMHIVYVRPYYYEIIIDFTIY